MKAQNKKILTVICMLLICLAGYSGYRAYEVILGYRQARQAYREYSQEYVVYNNGSGSPEAVFEEEPAAPSETSPLSVDFHDLRKNLNPEICAWILCPDTVINYPVVQHSENGYYLNVNVNGEQSASGAIFLDSANFSDFRDTNNILHGHHMGDGSMFASLDRWQQEEYLAEHPVIYLSTPSCNYRVDIIAGFTTLADSDAYRYEFSSIMDIQNWISWIREMSVIQPDIDLSPTDRFLTMSTCAYSYEDARTVLIGRLHPIDKD